MRYVKLGLGLLVLLVALWIIVGEQLAGASADATINAPVVLLRSPVAGIVDIPKRQIGSSVNPKDLIATVSDPAPDRIRLSDLEMERETSVAQLKSLKAQKTATEAAIAKLNERSAAYHKDRITDLQLQLKFAQEQLGLLQPDAAAKAGAQAHPGTTALDISRARERVAVLANDLAAAQGGVYLGDGYNDMPYSEQHRTQLADTLASLDARITQAQETTTAIETRIKTERKSLSMSGLASIEAGVDGIYWQDLARDGTYVNRGDPVARVADCGAQLVTASVPEGTYQTLERGMEVTFRANGSRKTLQGVIVRLAGAGARTVNENMAVAPSEKHLQRYDVAISIPALERDDSLYCAIGRTGRVFFATRPLDRLRSLF